MNREEIFIFAISYVQNNIQAIKEQLNQLNFSLKNETKSAMGDKYETTTEMIQQEKNRLLENKTIQENHLQKLNQHQKISVKKIQLGAIIETSEMNIVLSSALGKLTIKGVDYFFISEKSPLGNVLLQNSKSEEIIYNNKKIIINNIL